MVAHLQLINFWCKPNSRWLPQLIDHHQLINSHNSVNCVNNITKFDATVAESSPDHIFEALTNLARACILHEIAQYFIYYASPKWL